MTYQAWRQAFHDMLDPRFYPASWLDAEIAAGRMMLMAVEDAAILFSVKVYPSGLKELQGEAACGNREAIVLTLIPAAERWAKSIGCESAVIQSREGWSRVMRKFGYSPYQTSIRKVL